MKQKVILVLVMIMVLAFFSSPMQAQETYQKYNVKLSLGYGFVTGGDIPAVTDGMNEMLEDLASLAGGTATDELGYPKWGPDIEFEFIYKINEKFGIGVGGGYIVRSTDTMGRLSVPDVGALSLTWDLSYTEIPIVVNGYYFFPLGSKLKGYAKAGVGYYFGKLDLDILQENTTFEQNYWEKSVGVAKDSGLGFQGALGLEFPVAQSVALIAEASGRYVYLNNWDVEVDFSNSFGFTEEETGLFWYAEEFDDDLGRYYPTLLLDESEPSDPGLRDVREAQFSSTGIVFKIGIKIGF